MQALSLQSERMFDTMASIKQIGNSYKIIVSNGYDVNGKKIRETTTFTPDQTITPKQQQKALEKFVFEFEERVKNGKYLKGEKITFKEFTNRWLQEYANQQLELTTIADYTDLLEQMIIPAIGHLSKIQPLHLQSY